MTNKKTEITEVTALENASPHEEVYKTIAENMNRDAIMQRLAARENSDYLSLCNKYDIRRTISFDMLRKTIVLNFPLHKEIHPIGELLISLLDVDFKKYEGERKSTIDTYEDPNTDFELVGFPTSEIPPLLADTIKCWGITLQKYSKMSLINKLVKFNIRIHPYLTFYPTEKLMQSDGGRILKKELDMISIQNRIKDMAIFCLDTDHDERLKNLTALQRYYIYKNTQLDVPVPHFITEITPYPSC